MKASIVIPMYNAEKHIEKVIKALKYQSEKNTEIIIVDDGSTDGSLNLVKKYVNSKIKLIYQENQGPAVARNRGIKEAKSDILIFLDSDCIPAKSFVKNILKPFKNPRISGVQGDYITKNFDNFMARYIGYEIGYRHKNMKGEIDHIATYACAYRKKDLVKGFLANFKEPNMEDIELSYRLSKQGKKLVFMPSAKVKHPHPENIFKYLKQQFKRGYWRVLGHYKYPQKLIKDSYFGHTIIIQGILTLLLFISILFSYKAIILSSYALYISNFSFGLYCFKKEMEIQAIVNNWNPSAMIVFVPLIASFRSIVGVIGFGWGIINFLILRK